MVNDFHHLPLAHFGTILADPPWRFDNATGKVAPEHKRLHRYATMSFDEIRALPVSSLALPRAHLYLWCPNALLADGLATMQAWGFTYKTYILWHKLRKDGGSDGRGVGFYFRNVTELVLFGIRGKDARTREAGRSQVNYIGTRKREHSRKPDELYPIIEACSHPPYVELFATRTPFDHDDWTFFGKPHARRNEASGEIEIIEVDAVYREIEAQREQMNLRFPRNY
jgi:N6-adenosine-specific RNA methylase IME4